MPPTDQPDFTLRRYEGLRIHLSVHEAEEKMAKWDVLLSTGGLLNGRFVHSDLFFSLSP